MPGKKSKNILAMDGLMATIPMVEFAKNHLKQIQGYRIFPLADTYHLHWEYLSYKIVVTPPTCRKETKKNKTTQKTNNQPNRTKPNKTKQLPNESKPTQTKKQRNEKKNKDTLILRLPTPLTLAWPRW